jgi:hypothetical protein
MEDTKQASAESFTAQARAMVEAAVGNLYERNGTNLELRPATLRNGPLSVFDDHTAVFILAQERTGLRTRIFGAWEGVAGVVVKSRSNPYCSETGYIVDADIYSLRGNQSNSIGVGAFGFSDAPATAPAGLAPDVAKNVQWAFDAGLLKQPKPVRQVAKAAPV